MNPTFHPPTGTSADVTRRSFLRSGAAAALAVVAPPAIAPVRSLWAGTAAVQPATQPAATSESLVKVLFASLKPEQKRQVCFPWDHVDPDRGLLRTRVENNWRITKRLIKSDFYTAEQQALIRKIFEGMTSPDWHARFDKQLKDDVGGFGHRQSIAIFGDPGAPSAPGETAGKPGKFEFVLASRHMTLRCDGHSADHVALGGPILYAHQGEGLHEKPTHPSNVFWHQAVEANKLYQALDARHRALALVKKGMPSEELVGFKGKKGEFQGCPVTELSADQKGELQRILGLLLEPFRKSDQDEVVRCLKVQGGLDQCHLAFYEEGDLGNDGVYDNWRIEGPSFVWYFRGKPHVHVWVHVADDPSPVLNSFQDSIM